MTPYSLNNWCNWATLSVTPHSVQLSFVFGCLKGLTELYALVLRKMPTKCTAMCSITFMCETLWHKMHERLVTYIHCYLIWLFVDVNCHRCWLFVLLEAVSKTLVTVPNHILNILKPWQNAWTFCWWHYQMHFSDSKYIWCDWNFNDFFVRRVFYIIIAIAIFDSGWQTCSNVANITYKTNSCTNELLDSNTLITPVANKIFPRKRRQPRASCQILKIAGCPCSGNAGNVFPSPRISNPYMHHGTCVTCACATRNFTYLARGP